MSTPGIERFPGAAPMVNRENPWPGLAAFGESNADFFFGRSRELEDLFTRVRLNPLTVLYGQSGLGKTSLVQAALFPRLRSAKFLPVSIRIDYSPSADPARVQICQAISRAVAKSGGTMRSLGEYESLWELFHRPEPAAVDPKGNPLTPVLAFDQFEELFTLGGDLDDEGRFVRAFVEELASLCEGRAPSHVEARFDQEPQTVDEYDFDRRDYRILISLREDFLAHLHDLTVRIPSVRSNNMRLTPLDGLRALEVVEKPGAGIVAEGAARAIVRFVADAGEERKEGPARKDGETGGGSRQMERPIESLEVDPSLLSLFCQELNERRGTGMITTALVAASREKILSDFYERSLSGLHPGVRLFVEEDLLTAKGFRQTLSLDSAEERLKEYGASLDDVRKLVNLRFLHFEQRGRMTRVELTHDVLTRVVRDSRNERQAKEAEEARRREAEESEQRAELARKQAEAEKAAAEKQLVRVRKQQRATRIWLGVAVGLAVVATGFLLRAVAERSRSNRLLESFCLGNRKLLTRLGDSTESNTNLTNAYRELLVSSDTAVEQMLRENQSMACPHQLEVLNEVASAGVERSSNKPAALPHALRALSALRGLGRFGDPESRLIRARSYSDLAYTFWLIDQFDSAVVAAREGIPAAAVIRPEDDSTALDRVARMAHYAALSLIQLSSRDTVNPRARLDEAARMADSGLAAVETGLARPDQDGRFLRVSKAQLLWRRGEVDSARQDTTAALDAYRKSLDALVAFDLADSTNYSLWWRGIGHNALGILTLRYGKFDEAELAYDSSAAVWHRYAVRLKRLGNRNRVETAYGYVAAALMGKARIAIRQSRRDAAVQLIHAAVDSVDVAFRNAFVTLGDRSRLSTAYRDAADLYELMGLRDSANAFYLRRVTNDSTRLAMIYEPDVDDYQDQENGFSRIVTVVRTRALADTAGEPKETQLQILKRAEQSALHWRSRVILVRERALRRALTWPPARRTPERIAQLRDSVAEARGNYSWSALLTGQPEDAETMLADTLAEVRTGSNSFILPNRFNALVMSERQDDASEFFKAHAGENVETPPVPFPCAVVRDIRVLHWRGVATAEHVQFVEALATAPVIAKCQLPTPPSP